MLYPPRLGFVGTTQPQAAAIMRCRIQNTLVYRTLLQQLLLEFSVCEDGLAHYLKRLVYSLRLSSLNVDFFTSRDQQKNILHAPIFTAGRYCLSRKNFSKYRVTYKPHASPAASL